jgi:hypothetical protein
VGYEKAQSIISRFNGFKIPSALIFIIEIPKIQDILAKINYF